jgi:predicted transcriptional regulator
MPVALTIELPEEIASRFREVADEREQSQEAVLYELVTELLSETSDARIALARMHDAGDPVISSAELMRRLALED